MSAVIFPLDGTGRTIEIGAGIVTLLLTDLEQEADVMIVQLFEAGRKIMVIEGSTTVKDPDFTASGTPGPPGTPRLGGPGIWGYWVRGQAFKFAVGDTKPGTFDIEIFFAKSMAIGGTFR